MKEPEACIISVTCLRNHSKFMTELRPIKTMFYYIPYTAEAEIKKKKKEWWYSMHMQDTVFYLRHSRKKTAIN